MARCPPSPTISAEPSAAFVLPPDEPLLDDSQCTESAEHHTAPLSGQNQLTRLLFALIYELCSIFFATIALILLIVLLKTYDRKPMPRWSLGPWAEIVTLNAVISVISTVFRACVLLPVTSCLSQFGWIWFTHGGGKSLHDLSAYDSASRGPLGSLTLLFKLRFMQYASIGAWIMLAAVALGPFFQQSVTYIPESTIDPSYSPGAQAVAAYSWGESITGFGEVSGSHYLVPYDMQAAIRSGLIAPNPLSIPPPPFTCPTGNCTWDPFGTLAVRAKCYDTTSLVSLDCDEDEGCRLIPPQDSLELKRTMNATTSHGLFYIESSLGRMVGSPVSRPFYNLTGTLAIVQWVKASVPGRPNVVNVNSTIDSHVCAIYFCLQKVLPEVSNGIYSERVLEEVSYPENARDFVLVGSNNTENTIAHIHTGSSKGNSSLVYRLNDLPQNRTDVFVVPWNGFISLSTELVTGQLITGTAGIGSGANQLMGTGLAAILYKANDTVRAMENLAASITTQLRANGSIVNQQTDSIILPENSVSGHVWIQQQTVIVRWRWLTLPAVLLALTALLVVLTFFETRASGIGMWLSSPLTLLFHARLGLEAQGLITNAQGRSAHTADSMQKVAKQLRAEIAKGSPETIEITSKVRATSLEVVELLPRRVNRSSLSTGVSDF